MAEQEELTKDYLYKVKRDVEGEIRDGRAQPSDAGRENRWIWKDGRIGLFKPTLNVRKKDFTVAECRKTASEYGEFIGYKFAKMIGLPVCEVEMVEKKVYKKYSKSGKFAYVPGAISYKDLQPGESLVSALEIVDWYRNEHYEDYLKILNPEDTIKLSDYEAAKGSPAHNNNIEVVIPAFQAYAIEKCGASPEESEAIKQNIINMVMFDCKFANTDRNDENYGLSVDYSGKTVRFYPMYDNEYILGFSEPSAFISLHSATSLQEHINGTSSKGLKSRMGVTSTPTNINFESMYTYLFSTYPYEAKKAADMVSAVTEHQLTELMNECEGLDDIHKDYALRIFRARDMGLKYVEQEYIDENGNLRQTSLPGNKPSEITRSRSGSGSASKGKSNKSKGKSGESKEERLIGE